MGQDEIQKTRQGRAVLGAYLPAVRESLAGLRQRRVLRLHLGGPVPAILQRLAADPGG